jgi:rhodanese-related sulfurtransferase
MSGDTTNAGLARGMLAIVVTGALLGFAYNWIGLAARPAWGLPWIAEDRATGLATLEGSAPPAVPASPGGGYGRTVSDDPMAIPGGAPAQGVPEVPDLDRPIEVQLGAVRQFVDAGAALIVDAREREEFEAGRIPGAVSLPFDEATADPAMIENLDTAGRPIIVYCGGGTCELSISLAWDLLNAGHRRVMVYKGGFPEWSGAGQPVEQGPGRTG